jgi:hypothetical protein
MSLFTKNRNRMRRHLSSAGEAMRRADDGLDMPEHSVQEDAYVLQQLAVAEEAIRMARDVMLNLQQALADAIPDAVDPVE